MRRVYASTVVKHVNWRQRLADRGTLPVTVGIDIGKYELLVVCRWADGRFERPWRVQNPDEIGDLVQVLRGLGAGRRLVVALESSGTYGDALRQALADHGIEVQRVSTKAAHDYAEVFDGVPSQHDGKDAAVVAELAAIGKSCPWPYQSADAWQQELTYWVDGMTAQRQMLTIWQGRLEGLLGRHWPEATRVLKLSSATLLRVLARYGSPQALAADAQAAERLARWGGRFLDARKVRELLSGARTTVGVRAGAWQAQQIRDYAEYALKARQQRKRSERRLRHLARGHAVLQSQGKVIGVPSACVLWVSTGDPRHYYAAQAYRKAMGLNLVERSSGVYQGQLRISKRGNPRSRQWLYLAVLRLVQKAGVRSWYEAKKTRSANDAKRILVALMRKLAVALYHVAVHGQPFHSRRLFHAVMHRSSRSSQRQTALGGT